MNWGKMIWCNFISPSKSFMPWRLIHKKIHWGLGDVYWSQYAFSAKIAMRPLITYYYNLRMQYSFGIGLVPTVLWLQNLKRLWRQLTLQRTEVDEVILLWKIRNWWSNCLITTSSMRVHLSHIFRDGNCYTNTLVRHGHNIQEFKWWSRFL